MVSWLDLGKVEVMARIRLNGTDCGIAWKPPYRVDITRAARAGKTSWRSTWSTSGSTG